MLTVNKFLARSWKNIAHMTFRQYCQVGSINNKFLDTNVLIQDFNRHDLYRQISQVLGKDYLHPLQTNQNEFQEVRTGIIYGAGKRGFITLPTRANQTKPIWIHYLIDTGAPETYLTNQAFARLQANKAQQRIQVSINRQKCNVRRSGQHFSQMNILGMDFLENRIELIYYLRTKIIKLIDQNKQMQ